MDQQTLQIIEDFNAADSSLTLGNLQEARRRIDRMSGAVQKTSSVIRLRCEIYAKAEQWKELEMISLTGVELYPSFGVFQVELALALCLQGRMSAGLRVIDDALKRYPQAVALALELSCAKRRWNELPEIERLLTQKHVTTQRPVC